MGSPHRLTLLLSLGLVTLMALGGGAAYAIGHLDGGTMLDGRATASTGPGGASGVATTDTPSAGTGGSDGVGSSGGGAAAGSSTGSDAPGADEPVAVDLSPSAETSPNAQDVADLVSRYFTAINRHDYDAWLTTVSTAQAKRDRDDWTKDYSTTSDSDIYISDITAGKPMTVRMQFTSHQAISFAPTQLQAECVRWDVTYQVVDEGVGLRVGTSAKQPAIAPC